VNKAKANHGSYLTILPDCYLRSSKELSIAKHGLNTSLNTGRTEQRSTLEASETRLHVIAMGDI